MSAGNDMPDIHFDTVALDRLMPMHVLISTGGVVLHAGPTISKIFPEGGLVGHAVGDVFETRSGAPFLGTAQEGGEGRKLRLRLRHDPGTTLVGSMEPLVGKGLKLINLSFGISVIEAVAQYDLAGSDFAATDLTLELLYLVEAKTAAMTESRNLNRRLDGARQAAEEDAASDMLTGLKNRRVLDQALARKLARGEPFTLMQLDLDYFKAVNDTLGHAAGDAVLVEVARILTEETRPVDIVARVGGDEFVLIIDGANSNDELVSIARRLIDRLEKPIRYREETARISGSIGMVSSRSYRQPNAVQMMEDADRALYASKERGRACFTIFPDGLETGAKAQEA